MVIYEVNVTINEDIFNDYYKWLIEHIGHLLAFDGFEKAEVGVVELEEGLKKQQLRISYYIDFYDNLQDYLQNHAQIMRTEAQQRFGDKVSTSRRVILDPIILSTTV